MFFPSRISHSSLLSVVWVGCNNLARNVELGSGRVVAFNFNVTLHENIEKTTFYQQFFLSSFIFLTFLHILHNYPADTRYQPGTALSSPHTQRWKNNTNIMNNGKYQDCPCNQRTMTLSISLQYNAILALMSSRHKFSIRLSSANRARWISLSFCPCIALEKYFLFYKLGWTVLPETGWFIQNIRMKSVLRYVGVFMFQYCPDTAANLNHSD